MQRSLGDGGMPLLGELGLSFDGYGEGWSEAAWTPTTLACNPAGIVHGGVYGVIHDAAMNFATNSALESGDRATTLDVQYQTMRPAQAGDALRVRGAVVRVAKQVAYVEAEVRDVDGVLGVAGHEHLPRAPQGSMTGGAVAQVEARGDTRPILPLTKRFRFGWIAEAAGFGAIYLVYDRLREQATGTFGVALRNAKDIVAAEKFLGIYWEHGVQQAFVNVDWFMAFWNIYYGTVHFIMPPIALIWMYRKAPERYVRFRNTLVIMFGLACIVFAVYPLNPPRLMPDPPYKFVDTAADYFNFGPQFKAKVDADGNPTPETIKQFGNPFAAMPSFHVGWSTWSVLAIWPLVRKRWKRALLIVYLLSVIFCIVVTGNHWLLDAVGGWIVVALGYAGALGVEAVTRALRRARAAPRGAAAAA